MISESGLASLTRAMSEHSSSRWTIHSWSTSPGASARRYAPLRSRDAARSRIPSLMFSNGVSGSPPVVIPMIWPPRLRSLPAHKSQSLMSGCRCSSSRSAQGYGITPSPVLGSWANISMPGPGLRIERTTFTPSRHLKRSAIPGVRFTNPLACWYVILACFAAAAPTGIHGDSE